MWWKGLRAEIRELTALRDDLRRETTLLHIMERAIRKEAQAMTLTLDGLKAEVAKLEALVPQVAAGQPGIAQADIDEITARVAAQNATLSAEIVAPATE